MCAEKPRVQTTSPVLIDETPATVITDAVERVSSIILTTDPDDVMGLAGAHTCFQQIMAAAKEGGTDGAMPAILEQATTAEKIVEHLILRETPDPEDALKEVRRIATRLQELLRGDGVLGGILVILHGDGIASLADVAAREERDERKGDQDAHELSSFCRGSTPLGPFRLRLNSAR